MAYSRTVFVGNLTKDPELRQTQTGKSVCSFSIAVKRRFQDVTDFHNCVAWDRAGEVIAKNFFKGKEILVEGELQNRSYEDNEGNTRRVTELKVDNFAFVGRKGDEQRGEKQNDGYQDFSDLDDEDLPF